MAVVVFLWEKCKNFVIIYTIFFLFLTPSQVAYVLLKENMIKGLF